MSVKGKISLYVRSKYYAAYLHIHTVISKKLDSVTLCFLYPLTVLSFSHLSCKLPGGKIALNFKNPQKCSFHTWC